MADPTTNQPVCVTIYNLTIQTAPDRSRYVLHFVASMTPLPAVVIFCPHV
jgi:hypothetical protein